MSVVDLARPGIRKLRPYEAAVQVDDTIRLNANEAPWRSSRDQFSRPLNRYPEIRPARLQELLAGRYGCEPANLLVTRGSSEAIDLLMRVFCDAGSDSVVTTSPTFSMYEHYAIVQGAILKQVTTDRDNDFDVRADDIIDACDDSTKLVFLCSPNNPTGTLVKRSTLTSILKARRDRSVVVVDEAYIEFSGQESVASLMNEFDNLVVLRTLSKALAHAGARCGAVIASLPIIQLLNAVQAPYALATPVIECVERALEADLDEADDRVAETISQRQHLVDELNKLGIVSKIWPSAANFLLVEVANAKSLVRHCEDDQVLLRHFGGSLGNCVRITVGSPQENDRLLDSLATRETGNG